MKVCGIDIRGKDVILVIGELDGDGAFHGTAAPGKISVADEDNPEQLRSVKATVEGLLKEHQVEFIGILGHRSTGKHAVGAALLKLEAVVQLNDVCPSQVFHPNTVAATVKKMAVNPPAKIHKYAGDALNVAATATIKGTAL